MKSTNEPTIPQPKTRGPDKAPRKRRKPDVVQLHTNVLPETKAALDRLAAASGASLGEVIDRLVPPGS